MTMKEIFMKEALKNIAKDWDISGESYEFTSVMNEYDFTFEKVETEEDKKRAYQIIDRLFVYLYPYLGGSRSEITTTSSNSPCTETSDDTDGEWVPLPITMYVPDGKGGFYPTIIYQPTYIQHQKNHDNNSESGCTQKESSSIASVVIPILIVLILVLMVIYS